MAIYSGETDGYKESCLLVENLRAAGIEASIGAGCVAIGCKPDQVNLAKEICKKSNAIFRTGHIGKQQELFLQSSNGREYLKQSKANAQAIVKEWEE